MVPDLKDIGPPTPWPVLPPGIHVAKMSEIEGKFATTPHRMNLFDGFSRVVQNLVAAGCSQIYLDGSFVTGSPRPGDFDGCWNPMGVDPNQVDPVLLDFDNKRANQKKKYFGEMFFSFAAAEPEGTTFLEFFQRCKYSGHPKGIIQIDPSSLRP